MNIVVLATASRVSGALSIYRQFLKYLPDYVLGHHFYLFIDPSMDHPYIDGVTYVMDSNHSWIHRIWNDRIGLRSWCTKIGVIPDVVVSLQNTGTKLKCPHVIYYHQSIPFYERNWNPLKKSERLMFLYKHIYPWFVSSTLNDNTNVVVQIPFIKDRFQRRFRISADRINVLFPDVEKINVDSVIPTDLDPNLYHFVYPAISAPYKEHYTLVEAIRLLKVRDKQLTAKIRIYFTFTIEEYPVLWNLIREKEVEEQFVFGGKLTRGELFSLYKMSKGLLFPSTIETLGLPLVEAANFGIPIIVADAIYAHEVLKNYSGVKFISANDYLLWSIELESLCMQSKTYPPLQFETSTWPTFYDLIFKAGNER